MKSSFKLNPFNPNSVVMPTLFAGRSQQILGICNKLNHLKSDMPASFFLYGERGIGKTALAKLIRSISTGNIDELYNLKLIASYYAVEKGQNLGDVLQASLNNLTDSMSPTLLDKLGKRLGSIFKNGKFSIGAFGANIEIEAGASQANIKATVKDQISSILSNLVRELKSESEDDRDGVLIIIDEMHNLTDLENAASVLRNIITTLDFEGHGRVSFLLIGYEEDQVKFFSEDVSSKRTFDLIHLETMPPNEASELLTKGFEKAGVRWDEESLRGNVSIAGGYPHALQRLGHNLIEEDADNYINEQDWSVASIKTSNDLVMKEFAKLYSFGKAQNTRDKVLIAIALSVKPLTKKTLKDKKLSSNIYQDIALLKKSGAIREDEEGGIHLHSQLFRTAVLFDHFARKFKD